MLEELLRQTQFHNIFRFRMTRENTGSLDLSKSNDDPAFRKVSSLTELQAYIENELRESSKTYAYGGYGEHRAIYSRFSHFNRENSPERDYHLGTDVWCEAYEPLFSPLDAVIHSFANNDNPGDYGGTIILQHELQGQKFHTLYGHLSLSSLEDKEVGQQLAAGKKFAELGDASENGGWPPHLHFQVIADMEGWEGDYPGVASAEEKQRFLQNCPDPKLILDVQQSG